ncbi:probable G-protein coupled receptor B0563.6 [Haliotis cracherodii]|uniref:probable G-protein coupled receptor B0563.6 n=1 Tax=Haliotis cracherodii TaxID=6455 RepID=UPI0039EA5AAC
MSGLLFDNMTTTPNGNVTGNISLEVTTYRVEDALYLSEDDRLKSFLEFQVSWYLDVVYAPICSILGIVGNTLSFIVLLSSNMRNTTSYLYMAALSCTDTIVLILNILFMVTKFPDQEIFNRGTCGLIFFLMYFSIHYNVFLMCTMTIERYIAVKFPLHAPKWITINKARILILVEFIVAFSLDVHSFFTRQIVVDPNTGVEKCTTPGETNTFFVTKIWPWVDAVVYCYGPLTCLLVVNVLIITEVKRAGRMQREMTNKGAGEKTAADARSRERQVTVMLLSVSFTFLIFVTPMAVIIVVERYFWVQHNAHEQAQYHLVRTICNNMMYTNHALNFVLYCVGGKRFRDQFFAIFCCVDKQKQAAMARSMMSMDTSTTNSRVSVVSNGNVSVQTK